MTNWMTAAGIALIAGGLATLIGFRRAPRTGSARGQRRSGSSRSTRTLTGPRRAEPVAARPRVRPVLPVQAGAPDISGSQQAADILAGLAANGEAGAANDEAGAASGEAGAGSGEVGAANDESAAADGRRRRPRGGPMDMDDLRRQLRDALEDLRREPRDEPEPAAGDDPRKAFAAPEEPEHRRLARAVLARADAGTREGARFDPASGQLVRPPFGEAEAAVGDPAGTRAADVLGDRVDGWVRPQYGAPEGPTGDYWKPVPHGAYTEDNSAYGWPVPVERLPAARGYPAPGDGAVEESEPTAVVPQWPPARPSDRIELPRTWSVRRWDADAGGRDLWRPGNVAEVPRRRPSPRPNVGPEARSTVYVSRHAAEPS